MKNKKLQFSNYFIKFLVPLFILGNTAHAENGEFSGWVNVESRFYPDTGESVDEQYYPSAAFQLDYFKPLNDTNEMVAGLFVRVDAVDDERNQIDVRELLWIHYADSYQLRAGVGQVSWGVNEVFKITDLVNQKDRAEIPYQRKLGQPLVGLSFYWGEDLIELYTLYGLRPAWFPGEDGRLRYPILVDPDNQEYDRGQTGEWDFAARWKTRWGNADISLSHFYGVTRDPYFVFNLDFENPYLLPVYEKVNQSSANIVYPWNEVLLKGEFTYQTGGIEQFESVAGGFEFTMGGIFESAVDLTWYVEAIWDSRDQIYATLFDHDVAVAARFAFNDARDSNLVLGLVADYEYDEAMGYLFWTNTMGQSWTLNVSAQYFMANEPRLDPLDYQQDLTELVTSSPVPDEVINRVAAYFEDTTLSSAQLDQIKRQLAIIQNDSSLFNNVESNVAAQTIFDLLRISDNTQKMNLIERDAYVQLDVFYHF